MTILTKENFESEVLNAKGVVAVDFWPSSVLVRLRSHVGYVRP